MIEEEKKEEKVFIYCFRFFFFARRMLYKKGPVEKNRPYYIFFLFVYLYSLNFICHEHVLCLPITFIFNLGFIIYNSCIYDTNSVHVRTYAKFEFRIRNFN